jgi:hypothetical protein
LILVKIPRSIAAAFALWIIVGQKNKNADTPYPIKLLPAHSKRQCGSCARKTSDKVASAQSAVSSSGGQHLNTSWDDYSAVRNGNGPMSALGQKRTLRLASPMSALPPKADIGERNWDVRFVPKADIEVGVGYD